MSFYDMLSSRYDDIFPYDPATADFILSHVPSLSKGGRVLDIGCATGSLACDLASRGASVDAIAGAVAGIWTQRDDNYSERRSAQTAQPPDLPADAHRIEMSYIGG